MKMSIKCDVCSADVTPTEDDEHLFYDVINLNGKICLCTDCKIALGHFVRSKEFKKVSEKYKEQFIEANKNTKEDMIVDMDK